MNWIFTLLICAVFAVPAAPAAEGARVVKVLPHYLDAKGRHTLSPSHFERDAYQDLLRKHPEKRSALRFDVQCKGVKSGAAPLKLRLEIRSSQGGAVNPIVLEGTVEPAGLFGNWTGLKLEGEAYQKCGAVSAWRATLWREGQPQPVSELKSFLW